MGALVQAITGQLAILTGQLIGPLGILLVTAGLAFGAIGVIFFHMPMHIMIRIIIFSVVLLICGTIAAGLRAETVHDKVAVWGERTMARLYAEAAGLRA